MSKCWFPFLVFILWLQVYYYFGKYGCLKAIGILFFEFVFNYYLFTFELFNLARYFDYLYFLGFFMSKCGCDRNWCSTFCVLFFLRIHFSEILVNYSLEIKLTDSILVMNYLMMVQSKNLTQNFIAIFLSV